MASTPRRYAGYAARLRKAKRAAIPRRIRRESASKYKANKENLDERTTALFHSFNKDISDVAEHSGVARSIIARKVLKDGMSRQKIKRAANARNGWVRERMAEVNKGERIQFIPSSY
jgi:ribonuclease D